MRFVLFTHQWWNKYTTKHIYAYVYVYAKLETTYVAYNTEKTHVAYTD